MALVFEDSTNIRRWSDSICAQISLLHKRMSDLRAGAPEFSESWTRKLIGIAAFDSLVFDPLFNQPQGLDKAFQRGADFSAVDNLGKGCAHNMALAGKLPSHNEPWHQVRLPGGGEFCFD